jgi:hypothetical protein
MKYLGVRVFSINKGAVWSALLAVTEYAPRVQSVFEVGGRMETNYARILRK